MQKARGQGPKKVTHDVERNGKTVSLGIDARVGAQTDVHQHQTNGRRNTQPDTQRDGLHDFFSDIQHRQDQKHDALQKDNHQRCLKGGHIAHTGHSSQIPHHDGKEAVQAHAGSHGKGLIRQKGHAEGAHGGGNTGRQEDTVPQCRPLRAEIGQQIGVQRHNVGHGQKGGQARKNLCFHAGSILPELENPL